MLCRGIFFLLLCAATGQPTWCIKCVTACRPPQNRSACCALHFLLCVMGVARAVCCPAARRCARQSSTVGHFSVVIVDASRGFHCPRDPAEHRNGSRVGNRGDSVRGSCAVQSPAAALPVAVRVQLTAFTVPAGLPPAVTASQGSTTPPSLPFTEPSAAALAAAATVRVSDAGWADCTGWTWLTLCVTVLCRVRRPWTRHCPPQLTLDVTSQVVASVALPLQLMLLSAVMESLSWTCRL